MKASQSIAKVLKKGDIVVYESTVYPGATEEVCIPELEKHSGLNFNKDFKGLNVKHQSTLLFLAISLSFTGCAVTSGLQTYDLPEQGTFKTEQGAEVSVVGLSQCFPCNVNLAYKW